MWSKRRSPVRIKLKPGVNLSSPCRFLLRFSLSLTLLIVPVGVAAPATAQHPPTQQQVNDLLAEIESTYGLGFAFPTEWQATTAGEVIQFSEYLTVISDSLAQTAYWLWRLNGSPAYMTPAQHFRLHFDRARIALDRTTQLGAYAGKTNPRYENGRVVGYLVQLTDEGMRQPFTLAHELGHVVDSLLSDLPHTQHVEFLGGVWGATAWLPGRGYVGNERLFPRAVGGPNEDFADTFGQMMMGRLRPLDSTAPRWTFMVTHTRDWLAAIVNPI
jgi:hypothetical protein